MKIRRLMKVDVNNYYYLIMDEIRVVVKCKSKQYGSTASLMKIISIRILKQVMVNISLMCSTWWQTWQLLTPNRKSSMGPSLRFKMSDFHPHVPWFGVIFKHLGTSGAPDHIWHKISFHLRSVPYLFTKTSSHPPSHPDSASHNWSLSKVQCPRERGEGSPGCCTREKNQHRREGLLPSQSSDNNKCLHGAQY